MSADIQSWRELANYLEVSVRTVQTWERERGLPVLHLPDPNCRTIAAAAEIDLWRAGNPTREIVAPSLPVGKWMNAALRGLATWAYLRPSPLRHCSLVYRTLLADDRTGLVSWTFQSDAVICPAARPGLAERIPGWRTALQEYWRSGHMTTFAVFDLNRDGHPESIPAGIHQALQAAEVLVLDPL